MAIFNNITSQEKEMLLKFPAYISLLAANSDSILDDAEEKSAIELAHIKTFSCDPLLADFYTEAYKVFKDNLEYLNKSLPKEKDNREAAIKQQLLNLETIVFKLGEDYTAAMNRSMKSFTEHVSRAHRSALVNFIFPMPIPGLTD